MAGTKQEVTWPRHASNTTSSMNIITFPLHFPMVTDPVFVEMLKDCRLFKNKKKQSEPEQALARKVGSHRGLSDVALKLHIDQEVLCVDFQLDDGEPRVYDGPGGHASRQWPSRITPVLPPPTIVTSQPSFQFALRTVWPSNYCHSSSLSVPLFPTPWVKGQTWACLTLSWRSLACWTSRKQVKKLLCGVEGYKDDYALC